MKTVSAPELVKPLHLWTPPRFSSHAPEIVDLAAMAGLDLDLEQELMVDTITSADPRGRLVALEACVIEARQNGKSVALEAVALGDLFLFSVDDDDLFVWSAHLFKTTVEAFLDIKGMIERTPELSRRVKRIHEGKGDEGIELHNGARLNFLARSKTGGRGLAGKRLTLDEAFALVPSMMGSIFPIMAAQPDAQVRYASSAGPAQAEQLQGVRDRGRAGGDPSLAYVEFGAPEVKCAEKDCDHKPGQHRGCALDDEDLWQRANPALGRRISLEYLRAERRALPVAEFMRERLSWWENPAAFRLAIDPMAWTHCAGSFSKPKAVKFAVDMNPDRTTVAIGVAGKRDDGRMQVDVASYGPAGVWLIPEIKRLLGEHGGARVLLDGYSAVSSLTNDLEAANIGYDLTSSTDMAKACGDFQDLVRDGRLVHLDDDNLNAAVGAATVRNRGDAQTWNRRDGGDICPLVSVALAAWGVQRPSVYEERGMVVL